MPEALQLWEVLVPTTRRVHESNLTPLVASKYAASSAKDARGCYPAPCSTRIHRVWDAKVRAITGGLTVLKPAKGYWVDPVSKTLFHDRTIPVRIACTRAQVNAIIKLTIAHYNQLAVMAYKLSDEVLIVNA